MDLFMELAHPFFAVATAVLTTTLLLFRRPRFLVDLWNSPPNLVLLLPLGILLVPSTIAECVRQVFCRRDRSCVLPKEEEKDDRLLTLPAHALSAKIRAGELTSVELTTKCIERIQKFNHCLNAVVVERFEEALVDARAADQAIAQGKVKPDQVLFGVPIVVKECFELKGLPFTAGIVARDGMVGAEDSTTMQRIKKDGLIIVGTTNVSEGCMFHESSNGVYGLTRNPWDLGRTAGGSSGGCGSAVAAGFAPIAVTSDVGGSTRIPAFYQGLFGHKPTGGTVPNTGSMPHVGPNSTISRYCQLGPSARSSFDLFPLLRTLAGPDGVDKRTRSETFLRKVPNDVKIDGTFIVYNVKSPFMPWFARCGLHPELRRAQQIMVDTLRKQCGVRVVDIDMDKEIPQLKGAFAIWAAMMQNAQEGVLFGEIIHNNSCCSLLGNLVLELLTCSLRRQKRHTVPAIGLALLDLVGRAFVPADHNAAVLEKGVELKAQLDRLLCDDRCVLICPSVLCPAPRHHENLVRFLSTSQVSIFNVMELPSTAVPFAHASEDGLPLGVQIVGGETMDHVTIAVANALEKAGVAGFPSRGGN